MPRDKRAERKHGKELKRAAKRRGLAKRGRANKGAKGKIFRSSTGGESPKDGLTSQRRGAKKKREG